MDRVVVKFGGASLQNEESFARVAAIIEARRKRCQGVVCVVSAMGSATDQLVRLAYAVNPQPNKREMDMLVTSGERVSMALLAMALDRIGVPAQSFTGSQSGIITTDQHSEAEVIDVKPFRVEEALATGKVAIVAGFQGVSRSKEVTTLGRGGSDTSAVVLAVALGASHVELYKDVGAFFDKDPKVHMDAQRFDALSFEEAHRLACSGAKILHPHAISLASKKGLPLHIRSFETCELGTIIGESVCSTI